MNRNKNSGFSFVEFLVAILIGLLILVAILLIWNTVEKSWHVERVYSRLICDLETFAERFKKEIGSSDANEMFYYPQNAATYTAISFPVAVDDDGDGFIEVDTDGNVTWDKTYIYHVYQTSDGESQLRLTQFSPRLSMSDADRQRQINEVVTYGKAISSTPNAANSSTRFLFTCPSDSADKPIELTIQPNYKEFDGYSAQTDRSVEISFGSVPLTAGEHYVTFTVTGTSQGGYSLGLDSFRISPSGGNREGEECTVDDDSGDDVSNEDMVTFGSWNGNRQLEYQADDEDDFITLSFYNDEWIETNFYRCSPSNTLIEYSNTDGNGGSTGVNDYVVRLSGYGETWNVGDQVGTSETIIDIVTPVTGRNYRNIISYQVTDTEGSAVRFQLSNYSNAHDLHIISATLFERASGSDGIESTKKIITFSGSSSVTIARSSSIWSDWINLSDIDNFNKEVDYLVSIFINNTFAIGMSSWQAVTGVNSYVIESDTDYSQEADWPETATANPAIFALKSIEVSYFASGALTSQIYDTGLANPDYSTLSWSIAKNNYGDYESGGLGANLVIKLRSHDDKDVLLNDNDWSDEVSINTQSQTEGEADISSVSGGRYIQFKAELDSQPTSGQYNYVKSCVLKKVGIKWPGESEPGKTTVVNLSGYITTRPDYGKFSVAVDGKELTKGLEVNLKLTKDIMGVPPVSRLVNVQIEPRNTGR